MISNVCKIEKGTKDLEAILKESESVAKYNGFNAKQTAQLRLICEEIDGMLPNIVDDFDGELFIECEDGLCKVNVSINFFEFSVEKKEELIEISKNKKNAMAKGILGKIRSLIEDLCLDGGKTRAYDIATLFNYANEYSVGLIPDCVWSLKQYKDGIKQDEAQEWDELEKSIITSIADDIIVGVKGKQANIIIVKNFK